MKKLLLLPLLLISFASFAHAQCQADYDEIGIVHQKVETSKDFYFCFGYHHGKDRAWQMDFFRRFAFGENAEVLGYKHIKNDFMMRLLGIPALAHRLYQDFPDEYKRILQDYSDGVNEGFKKGENADEFIQLGYRPSAWKPEHSISVLLLQSFDQTKKTFFYDILEQEKKHLYSEAASLFSENNSPWLTTILKDEEYKTNGLASLTTSVGQKKIKLWAKFPELFGENSGSNNWVLDSRLTENKHAIIANDPHLDLKTPLFWYWIHLKTPEEKVIGASLPGLPFVASGTNNKISWGLTNSYLNSADSVEISDLKKEEISTTRPWIWFKLGPIKLPFFFKSISKFKDIYPVLPLEVKDKELVILRWSGYNLLASEITPMFELFKKSNVKEADELLTKVGVPSWNYVFADNKGHIGYRMVGKTYQNEENHFGVQELTSEEFLNPSFLKEEDRPALLMPKRSFIATANNQHWPANSLYKGGGGYSLSFRAKRIEEELLKNKQNIETTKALQCDLFVTDAKYFIPSLQRYIPDFLLDWDYVSRDNTRDVSIYRRFMDLLMDKWSLNESALYALLKNLDEEKVLEMKELYKKTLKEVDQREWKDLSLLTFEHLSGSKDFKYSPELAGLGDKHTVAPGTTRWNKSKSRYEHFSGASMRMIIEMSNPVKIFLSLPGKNRDYQTKSEFNPWNEWRECRYFKVEL